MKRKLSAARIAGISLCGVAIAAFISIALPGAATTTSPGHSPQRADAAHAGWSANYSSSNDPLRKYYSPDDALKQGVVSGYVTGPAFPWSAQPGQTLGFHASSYSPTYNVQMVRMLNANPDPHGPGIVETPVSAPANGPHPGTSHLLGLGSYVTVPDQAALRLRESFTITAWIAPTTIPGSAANPVATVNTPAGTPRPQGLVTKSSGGQGYGLILASDGSLGLQLGTPQGMVTLETGTALRPWAPAFPWLDVGVNEQPRDLIADNGSHAVVFRRGELP
jgi:N,N-dimethylformamidase